MSSPIPDVDYRKLGDIAVTELGPAPTDRPPVVMVHGAITAPGVGSQCSASSRPTPLADHCARLNHGDSAALPEQTWICCDILTAACEDVGTVCAAVTREADSRPILIGHRMADLPPSPVRRGHPAETAALVLLAPVVPKTTFAPEPIERPTDPTRPADPHPSRVSRQLFFAQAIDEEAQRHFARLPPESPTAVWHTTRWTDAECV
ncbi:hypothetical protein [Rhodococcus sp. USK13]|uniref:hypothetical protein n=1 Tax=Rhodococcus sp. USK13 TaxID=2806442 RepID=UPI001BCC3476|nr:hypothetical protein [Rhodococcus sp. USK13]